MTKIPGSSTNDQSMHEFYIQRLGIEALEENLLFKSSASLCSVIDTALLVQKLNFGFGALSRKSVGTLENEIRIVKQRRACSSNWRQCG